MNQNPSKHINPYNQNVPDAFRILFNKGNVYVSIKQAVHNENVATDIAAPLILFGKISERMTHVTGASDMA